MNDITDQTDDTRLISQEIAKRVKDVLANYLGTEAEDIEDEDSFTDNLNMSPSDTFDFINQLAKHDIDTSRLDMNDIETVGDLIELLSSEEYL
jgi:acyl carrier protein